MVGSGFPENTRVRAGFSAIVALCLIFLATNARAQYSDDLKDIKAHYPVLGNIPVSTHALHPIGDLGAIETVVDLRGFVPLSRMSASAMWTLTMSAMRWYKIPTRKALLLFYTGKLSIDNVAADTTALEKQSFAHTRFLTERDVSGDTERWCKLAYDLSEKDSKRLF